jgi:hypothetical protein
MNYGSTKRINALFVHILQNSLTSNHSEELDNRQKKQQNFCACKKWVITDRFTNIAGLTT